MFEEQVINKLEAIRVSGSKGELWNFEAATILNYIRELKGENRSLKEHVKGYSELAKQIQEDMREELENRDRYE